jgi:ABC-type siderophore export system fused ATPase/permease subunit
VTGPRQAIYDERVKARSALVYTVLRLLAFLVPFGILMLFPIFRELYWLAAIFAALIGLSLSLLFLRRPLTEVTTGLAERRERAAKATTDEEEEDAAAAAATPTAATSADEGPEQEPAVRDRDE